MKKQYILFVLLGMIAFVVSAQLDEGGDVDSSDNSCPYVETAPTVTNYCGYTMLERPIPEYSYITYYWQNTATATSTSNSSTTINRTSDTVYYIKAYNHNTNCWGSARTVTYTVDTAPSIPTTPTVINNCGSTILTKGNPPSGITWYWQSSSTSTSTSNSSSSITITSGTTYYLRAKNNQTNCWSSVRQVSYEINTSGTWYLDTDNDGFAVSKVSSCDSPGAGYTQTVLPLGDYDDTTANIINIVPQYFYRDADTDGFGDPNDSVYYSLIPSGYVTNNTDQCPNIAGPENGCTSNSVDSSDENYVFTRSYQTPMSSSSQITQSSDVIEQITYVDGLGRPMQQVAIKAGGVMFPQNITKWDMDWTAGNGGTPFFNQNGKTSENTREIGINPYGESSLLWRCGNDADNNADGGWNTDYFNIDINTAYRYTVWVKRTHSKDGRTYHGTQNVNNLDGSVNSNPYFWNGDLPLLNEWYLLVGIIHSYQYTGGDTGMSGLYDLQGNKVSDGTEFKWRSDTSISRFRSYLYYATDVKVRQYFYNPILQKVNGSETPLSTLVSQQEVGDIVTHIPYDVYGRKSKEFLPYAIANNNSGSYRASAETETKEYYKTHYPQDISTSLPNPFSEIEYEASPINRVLKQAAPGHDWRMGSGHEMEFAYKTNDANEVRLYEVNFVGGNTESPQLSTGVTYYVPGELYKTITKDENHTSGNTHTTEEFTDKQGRIVLKRTYTDINGVSTVHDTYYVYDYYGNLTYILPPKLITIDGISTTELNELCYQYKYDKRNRLIEKKVPGKGWEYIIYNKLDLPILTQDANQRSKSPKEWLFTKYDAFGRVVLTGIYKNDQNRSGVQNAANAVLSQYENKLPAGQIGLFYYSKNTYPTNIPYYDVFTINYYDEYVYFDNDPIVPAISYNAAIANNTKGLLLTSKVKVLGENKWITTHTGYDIKSRPIYAVSKNEYLNTIDKTEIQLDFVGKVLETKTIHAKGSNTPIVTIDTFTYDQVGRLLKQTQSINNSDPEMIVINEYDDIGQLIKKKVGNNESNPLQTVNYDYNIRGWLKQINNPENLESDLFGFRISYNEGSNALYNGNIAGTEWKTKNIDQSLKNYTYSYDELNRITSGVDNTSKYDLQNVTYDKNGNIKTLNRKGHINESATSFGTMDNLVYTYNIGNKLTKVEDNGDDIYGFKDGTNQTIEYTYDTNGNMKTDTNKDITAITYNHLNLPTEVIFDNNQSKKINYLYDAMGIKIKKVATNGSSLVTTEYAGNYIYENNILQFFNQTEGYVEPNGDSGYDYIYQYKDHLGNIRVSYSAPENYEVLVNTHFDNGLEGWIPQEGVSVENQESRIKISTANKWKGIYQDISCTPGQLLKVEAKIDKATTDIVNFGIYEYDSRGNYIKRNEFGVVNGVVDGHMTLTAQTTYFRTVIGKEQSSDDGILTHYFIEYVRIAANEIVITEENNYYPFGLQHKGYNNVINGTEHNLDYQGKENQKELGLNWHDFGARNYDATLGRWINIDPLAENFQDVSPYNAMLNDPINYIDPDGRSAVWVPDSEGNLIAETGDNAQTLADYQGISYSEGLKQLTDLGYTVDSNGILDLKVGDKVELDNVFTESIDNSTGGFSTDVMMGLAPAPAGSGPGVTRGTPEDNYNCWGSACAGSQGKKIDNTVGIPSPTTFDRNLTNDYTPTTSANVSFGETVLRFADGGNNTQHGAVFYGRSKNGTTYVYTKNGWHAKPEVMKLSDLQTKIPSYGTVQGLTTGTSGYYDPNKP